MYKYETHLHTSEGSACGRCCGTDMADAAKNAGYDGIIVTDHFFNGNCAVPRDLPWKERVEKYCLGYEHAAKRGAEIGLKVFFGVEYTYMGSDFLTYGLDKEWFIAHPEVMDAHIYEYADMVAADGGFIVHAHPFRQAPYINQMTFIPDRTGAVEVVNIGNHNPIIDARAKWYAESYDLPQTAGSDAHLTSSIVGGIYSENELKSIDDYIAAVKARAVTFDDNKEFCN